MRHTCNEEPSPCCACLSERRRTCPTCKGEKFVGPYFDDNAGGNCSRDYCGTCGGEGVLDLTAMALVVIEAVLEGMDPYTECFLCETVHPDDGGDWQHSEECPLVQQGFVDLEGKRLFKNDSTRPRFQHPTLDQFDVMLESYQDPDSKRTKEWLYEQLFGVKP